MAPILVPGTLAFARVAAAEKLAAGHVPVSIFRVMHAAEYHSKIHTYEAFTEDGGAPIARVSPLCTFVEQWADLAKLRAAPLR